jgi:hypothetical protein
VFLIPNFSIFDPEMASSSNASKSGLKPSTGTSPKAPVSVVAPPPMHQSSSAVYNDGKGGDHITVNVHDVLDGPEAPSPNPLQIFHTALGIPPPKPVKQPKPTKKNPNPPPQEQSKLTAANKGVYQQVLKCERTTRYKYYFCDATVTLAMFLQIIVGASVTAFGAGNASNVLITTFGAANTALASLLAVLKSQGLPNRIRQDWNLWRELREFIEEKEREIELVVSGKVEGRIEDLDVWGSVRAIEARYQNVRLTNEANRPDTYIRVPPRTA